MQTLSQAPGKLGEVPAEPVDLLARLVALNAQRAAEEKTGHSRWLRLEFQYPSAPAAGQSLSIQKLLAQVKLRLQVDLALNVPLPAVQGASSIPAWPNTLPHQVRAVAQVLSTATAALPLTALEASRASSTPSNRWVTPAARARGGVDSNPGRTLSGCLRMPINCTKAQCMR